MKAVKFQKRKAMITLKVFIYGYREEETAYFHDCVEKYGIELVTCEQRATLENAHLAKGCTCISVLSTPMPEELIQKFYEEGVRFISTRTVGYDHIDLAAAKKIGMRFGNATYASESVADYTIMLILMTLRKMKLIMKSAEVQDYSFEGVQGRNLKNKTLGVIGTGNIGQTLIRHIAGFECRILAYAPHPKKSMESFVTYVDFDTLLKESDIITLHVPLNEDNYHMINEETIAKMKDGAIIVNTARGGLIDNEALIKALENHKLSGAALDVVEGETGIYYNNRKAAVLKQRDMAILAAFPNVIMSPHMAFLTDDSNRDMVYHSMESCVAFLQDKENPWEIK